MNRRQILKSILLAPFVVVGLIKHKVINKRVTVTELGNVNSFWGQATHKISVEFDYKGKIYCLAEYYDENRVTRQQIDRAIDKAIERTIKRVA